MYKIEIGDTGNFREATDAEVKAIRGHLVDYPRCDGTQMQDDNDQTMGLRPRLRCKDCRVKVTVRG
jgi:hypothetical protein